MASDFSFLAEGKSLGKRGVVINAGGTADIFAPVDILEIRGKDENACPVGITLCPPMIRPVASMPGGVFPANAQLITGEQDNFDNSVDAFVFAQPIAQIEWGIGGVGSKIFCDWENGCTVNLQASFVRVRALLSALSGATQGAYILSAFVGPSNNPTSNPRFTDRVGVINNGAQSSPRFLPFYAKSILPMSNVTPINCTVIFFRDRAGTSEVGRIDYTGGGGPIQIPAAGAYYFAILNNAAAPQTFRAIFTLAL